MPELSEMIRDHVDAVAPQVSLDDVSALIERGAAAAPSGRTRRRRVRVALVVAATTLVVALVTTLLIVPTGSQSSSAATALNEAAMVAASRPSGPVPHAHQYLYYEMTQGFVQTTPISAGQKSVLYRYTDTENTWVAINGTGRQRITYASPTVVLPYQRAQSSASRAQLKPPSASDTTFPTTFSGGQPVGGPLIRTGPTSYVLSYVDTAVLPTQTAALESYIERYYGAPRSQATTVFFFAANNLAVGASPAVRAALFKVVERLPGVTLLGRTKDASGRVGVGVALSTTQDRLILIFNPHTSTVLGDLTVTMRSSKLLGTVVPRGTLINFTTYGTTGVTSSITRLPNGAEVPLTSEQTSNADGSGALYVLQK
jgi:hypothetical protein